MLVSPIRTAGHEAEASWHRSRPNTPRGSGATSLEFMPDLKETPKPNPFNPCLCHPSAPLARKRKASWHRSRPKTVHGNRSTSPRPSAPKPNPYDPKSGPLIPIPLARKRKASWHRLRPNTVRGNGATAPLPSADPKIQSLRPHACVTQPHRWPGSGRRPGTGRAQTRSAAAALPRLSPSPPAATRACPTPDAATLLCTVSSMPPKIST